MATGKDDSRRHGDRGYQRRSSGKQRNESRDVKISKQLSYILRHGAAREGFQLQSGGFLFVDDLLKHKNFSNVSEKDIENIVESNDKKRFYLEKDNNGRLKIRANQGHTVEVENLDVKEIKDAQDFPYVVHGTYSRVWHLIKNKGLSKMKRNHIHLAPGIPGEDGVISGMRDNCDIVIYIDMARALADGIKFYQSSNNVILTEGNKDGILETKYFKEVFNQKENVKIELSEEISSQEKNDVC